MIPKIIHYCWFGRNPLPELALKCIESWKEFLPEYEIKEWNEDNYDVRKITYISQAYDAKKYAFVSDYARFDILYQYGGIYFDTDVEVIKDLTPIIEAGPFMGVEQIGLIATGLGIGSLPFSDLFKEILDSYADEKFLNIDGSLNLKTVVVRVSDIFRKHGFTEDDKIQDVKGYKIYPAEYFCPKNYKTRIMTLTENSYTIHHYDGSWCSEGDKKRLIFKERI
ncbi:MAG: glycosyl transferase, partial [Bacteroidales bacterium]|nr:glycosyl transferase [Bacteroidales bacterium]